MIYASNRRNQDDFDLYVMDVMNPTSETRVIESQGELWPAAFSPDGKSALVGRTTSHVSSRIYILDVERREMHELFADHAGRLGLWDADWSRDGRTLYLASELDGDFVGVHAFDRESGRAKLLTPNLTWDVSALELLPDGRTVALLVNEDAHGTLYLLNSITGQLVRAIGAPAGSISTIAAHPTLPLIAVDVISPLGVTGVWVYDVSAHRFSPWAVSDPDTSALPTAVTVRYPTFDFTDAGEPRTIPAVIFPAAAGFAGRRPVMIDIHGGPAMQATVAPRPHYEMIRRRGTTIIAPNVRGSRGYGKRYASLDDLTRREDAVRDIGALLDWIETRPDLDAARVSVAGGSYGGYMTLASLMHYGNRIRCGFDLFGISDFVTFLKSSEEGHYPDAQRAEFGDEHDPEMRAFLESISPARHAERIRVPLLIFQGSNDIRVRPRQSQHMVERIRAAGGTVTYVEAANEGHGLEQPLNQLYISALASEFMERCMAQPAMPPPSGMVSRLMLIREKLARQ
jgi:dipeptidyl aminopeptidase/acylaminoacyl peptidase